MILRRELRRPRAAAACSRPRCGSRSPPRPWPAVSFGVWDVLDRRSAAAWAARSSRSAPAWRSAALIYLGAAKLLRIAELEQIIRCCAAARCSASGRYLLGVARARRCSPASPGWGGTALRRRLLPELHGRAGPPGDRGDRARAPDLGRRSCSGTFGVFEPLPYLLAVGGCRGCGLWTLLRRVAEDEGARRPSSARSAPLDPRDRTRRPERPTSRP